MDQIRQIVKRDGRTVDFNVDKIADAIYKAAQVLGGRDRDMAKYLARQVELYLVQICHNSTPTVEQVQDAVEKILIENGHARTAKEFILYRSERTRVRDMNTRLMKTYEDLTFKDAADNDIKRENIKYRACTTYDGHFISLVTLTVPFYPHWHIITKRNH